MEVLEQEQEEHLLVLGASSPKPSGPRPVLRVLGNCPLARALPDSANRTGMKVSQSRSADGNEDNDSRKRGMASDAQQQVDPRRSPLF